MGSNLSGPCKEISGLFDQQIILLLGCYNLLLVNQRVYAANCFPCLGHQYLNNFLSGWLLPYLAYLGNEGLKQFGDK